MPSILNSDDGVVSGTSGLKSTGGNDGITAFQQNGTERMRIDSSGNVGIGTTSPTTRLHVSSGNNYANLRVGNGAFASRDNNNDVYLYSNSTTAEKYLVDGEASLIAQDNGIISFYNAPSGTAGNTVTFTERARIPAAGGFQCVNSISVGNATPTTSGAGITFPATQSASSNANTLDDYEEGTWTPEIRFGGNAVGVTYANQRGNYTKIGNRVFISMYLQLTNKGSSSGNISIIGLPFTSVDSLNQYNNVAVWIDNSSGITGSMQGYNAPNTSTISELAFANTGSQTVLSNTQLGNGSNFMVNFSYSI